MMRSVISRLGRRQALHRKAPRSIAATFSTSPNIVAPTWNDVAAATTTSTPAFSSSHHHDTATQPAGLTIGILRETYDAWERRTPLCPHHVQELLQSSTATTSTGWSQVLVQPSSQRCFSNGEYEAAGAVITDNLEQADIILGVKRPTDPNSLLANKTYVFFSHVIKGQESNMGLLQTILDKHIQLMDYECMVVKQPGSRTDAPPQRVVAFGKYAGLAGMIDTFYPLGRRLVTDYGVHTPFLQCPLASMQRDLSEAKQTIARMGEQIAFEGLPTELREPLVLGVTGLGGRVFGGAMEILNLLPQERVHVDDLPELFAQTSYDPYKVYVTTPAPQDIYGLREDGSFDFDDWRHRPSCYESKFATEVAPYIHALVNCIYWDARYARLLTKDEVQVLHENGQNRLKVVTDISCDINGSIEFLDRTCTIDKPFFQYNPLTRMEDVADIGDRGITVIGTDILPAELPKESSDHFGNGVVKVLQELADNQTTDESTQTEALDLQKSTSLLSGSCITTTKGELAPSYQYLDSFLQMYPSTGVAKELKMDVLLNGHLFDSGLINTVLDTAELLECGFQIINCRVNRGEIAKDVVPNEKSTALIQFSSNDMKHLDKLEEKIKALVDLVDKADATMKVVDRSPPRADSNTDSPGADRTKRSVGTAQVENQEEQRVLVLGAGRVSMSLVDLLGRTPQKHIQVASDNAEEAQSVAKIAQRGNHVTLDLNNSNELASLVKDQDVVISLLPAPMHPQVAEECIVQKTNLVTASYESPAMKELNERAQQAGIIILNEVGLDPGLDHMSAMKIIDDVTARGGTIDSFSSVCGGLPSPEAADNPLKYKFSWSPKGVISASQNAARYRWENEIVEVPGQELMQAAKPFNDAWPELALEVLPNRDSIKYESIYGIASAQTLFRGTLRYGGFCNLMSVFQNTGLFETAPTGAPTWKEALIQLMRRHNHTDLDSFLLECAEGNSDNAALAKEALTWLEMDGATPVSNPESLVDSFCDVLEHHLQFAPGERDMVAMHTAIAASFDHDGAAKKTELHQSSLLAFGDDSMSAMCRTVGFPAAAAADLILSGDLQDYKGLVLPTDQKIYLPILAAVEKEGIAFDESVKYDVQ